MLLGSGMVDDWPLAACEEPADEDGNVTKFAMRMRWMGRVFAPNQR
jgi:hypothetical protein